jgi:hypothetical protein
LHLIKRRFLLEFLRGCDESDDILEGEPAHKNSFRHLEKVLFLCRRRRLIIIMIILRR